MNRWVWGIGFLILLTVGIITSLGLPLRTEVITLPPTAMLAVAQEANSPSCWVAKVYDGDTFGCDLDGDRRLDQEWEKIRLLGIDTPEMHYSHKNKTGVDEPFAAEASHYAEQTLTHHKVYLEYDNRVFDRYGRTLAYVYLDPQHKRMINRIMVQQGLARTFFLGDNRRYEKALESDEVAAKRQHKGMWQHS